MTLRHRSVNWLIASVLVGELLGACSVLGAQPAELSQPVATPSESASYGGATEAPALPTLPQLGTPPGFPTVVIEPTVIEPVVTDPRVIALLAGLQQRGFPAQLDDASRVELLQDAPGQGYGLGDGSLYVHVYTDTQAAQARAASLPDAFERALFDWRAPPHFFQCDRLIVLYVGADERVVRAISELCAPPFYTSNISVGGPAVTLTPDAGIAVPTTVSSPPSAPAKIH